MTKMVTTAKSVSTRVHPRNRTKALTESEAFERINEDSFKELSDPPPQIMWRLLYRLPSTLNRMPQATKSMQIDALRRQGSLLDGQVVWKYDTEYHFPGSTEWVERYRSAIRSCLSHPLTLAKQIATHYESTWQPISELSLWSPSAISPKVRHILSVMPNEEAQDFIAELLKRGAYAPQPAPIIDDHGHDGMDNLF